MAFQSKRQKSSLDLKIEKCLTLALDAPIKGHYALLAAAKTGKFPDGRSKLGKTINTFRSWLREPYGDNWNTLQEGSEQLAAPTIVFYFTCPVLNEQGHLHPDYKWAYGRMRDLIKDIAHLADKQPRSSLSLEDYLRKCREEEVEKSKK